MSELVVKCAQLATPTGNTLKKGEEMRALKIIDNAGIAISDGVIAETGRYGAVRNKRSGKTLNLEDYLAIPAFVDCHTHAVFSGDRATELGMKLEGRSYREIGEAGGGILSTVKNTGNSSVRKLATDAEKRLSEMISGGTCCFEIKSGYALTLEGEIAMLKAIGQLGRRYCTVPTYMGAHTVPAGRKRSEYIDEIIRKHLPAIASANLAEFCDVFIESFAFTPEEGLTVLENAKKAGMKTTAHIDEFSNTGAAEMLSEAGVQSLSHLAHTGRDEFSILAEHGVAGVILPTTPLFSFEERYPDASAMVSEGMAVATGTDLSPNSFNMSMMLSCLMSVYKCRLRQEEALTASTVNSACVIGRGNEIGSVERRKIANLIFLPVDDISKFMYEYSEANVRVMNAGTMVR